MRYIGKIDKDKLGYYKDKLITDEVVLTDERNLHIYEDHKNDYERIMDDLDDVILNPNEVIDDLKNENTVFMIKKLEKNKLSDVVKLNVTNSKEHPKNSVMTAWIIRDKNLKKLEGKNKVIYKSE